MADLICPACRKILDMNNVYGYDNEEMKILGIIYIIQCKCGRKFISNMRMAKKLNKGQAKKLIEELKVKIDL